MNSSFPNRWSFSYLKFTKYVTNIIDEPKYKYKQKKNSKEPQQNYRLETVSIKYWGAYMNCTFQTSVVQIQGSPSDAKVHIGGRWCGSEIPMSKFGICIEHWYTGQQKKTFGLTKKETNNNMNNECIMFKRRLSLCYEA